MIEGVSGLNILLLVLLLALSAFFSSAEVAFVSQQRVQLRHRASRGSATARHVERLLEQPGRLLATVLLGDNLVKVAAAALSTAIAVALLGPEKAVLVVTVGVTTVQLIFAEIIPKTVAVHYPNLLATFYVHPIRFTAFLFRPVVWALGRLAEEVVALMGERHQGLVGAEEIRALTAVGLLEGSVEPEEAAMVERVFSFGDRLVREIMTPRPEVHGVPAGTTFSEFLSIYLTTTHTRLPVHRDDIDDIMGILFIKDVLRARARGSISDRSAVTHLARPALFVPETKNIGPLFLEMRSARAAMALIVDEYGSIAGLVTFKQLVEEVVGDVGDELVTAKPVAPTGRHQFNIEGRLGIDEANQRLALSLPHGEYQTVAGFLLNRLGHIPQEGEQVVHYGLSLTVERMQGPRIDRVLVVRIPREAADAHE